MRRIFLTTCALAAGLGATATALAQSPGLPLVAPEPVLARGEILSPNSADWLYWADESAGPPVFPLSELPPAGVELRELVAPTIVATPDRVLPLFEIDDYERPGARWVGGTTAPYEASSFDAWVADEPNRIRAEERRVRYGRPPPSQTRFIYDALGERPATDEDPEGGLGNLYFVREFDIESPDGFVALQMELEFAAGAVVYLNGVEIARHHVAPGAEAHGRFATPYWLPDHINQTMYRRWQMTWLALDPALLRPGSNVLSVAIYKRPTGGRRAMYFDLRLEGHRRADFLKTPYLQHLEQERVSVLWETTTAGYAYVEFGESPDQLDRIATTAQIAGGHHEVVLTGLQSNTRYYYRARTAGLDGDEVTSDVRSFRTAVPPGVPFSFIAYGDNRTNPDVHRPLVERMWAEAVTHDAGFILSTGDLVTNASPWTEWQEEFFRPALPLMGHFAYYTSLGNHEGNHESYYQYMDLPGNESWYSFRYGDAEFFALNSSASYLPDSPQHAWLGRALAASDAAWKIAFFHHPPYACTPSRKPGDLEMQEHIVPLLEAHGVDLVLAGHDHLYGRSRSMNGVTYVITGGGGAPLYPSESDEINEICRTEYHYCIVNVLDDRLEFRATALDGAEIDRFTLTH